MAVHPKRARAFLSAQLGSPPSSAKTPAVEGTLQLPSHPLPQLPSTSDSQAFSTHKHNVTCRRGTKPLTRAEQQPGLLHMTAWHPVSRPCQQCLAPAFRIASRQGEQIADGFLYLPNNLIAVVLATLTCSVPSPAPRQQGCKGSEPPGSERSPCVAGHVQPAHELPDTYTLRLQS